MDYRAIYEAIRCDGRYLEKLDWGEPRSGHPEGSVRGHIRELEQNLQSLQHRVSEIDYWKLLVLIHTHDTFKADAKPGVSITDPRSHATLARNFLAEFCDDADLLAMVQFHDEPYALWRQAESKGGCNPKRWDSLMHAIADWNLFLAFNIIDGCTAGKSRIPLYWLFAQVEGKVESDLSAADIL